MFVRSQLAIAAFVLASLAAPTQAELRLTDDLRDGQLDKSSLLEAAATIGQMNSQQIDSARTRLRDLVDALDREPAGAGDTDRLARLLALLHERIFTGRYDTSASQISTTLVDGNFNCVSSAVLFLIAAEMAEFSTRPVLLPGHVRCRVWIEQQERWVDIEPSVPDGQPNHSSDNYSPGDGRELTEVQLLAKLYYNLGIDQLHEGNHYAALRHARYGWQLDPQHTAAQDNVAAIFNNWSLALCQQGKFEEALRMIRDGLREAPDTQLLTVNEIHVYVTWMQELMRRGDLGGVEMRLHEALARYPESLVLQSIDFRLRAVGN